MAPCPELRSSFRRPPPPQLAPDAGHFSNGDVLVIWSVSNDRIAGREFDAALTPLGPEFTLNQTPGPDRGSALALAVSGVDYVAAWQVGIAPNSEIYARRFNRTTGALGNEFIANSYTTDTQGWPRCAMDAQGRSIIIWESYQQDGGSFGVFGQRLDVAGAKWGPEFRVNMTTFNPQGSAHVAALPAGDFLVTFGSATDPSTYSDVFVRRFFFPCSLAVSPGAGATNPPQVSVLRPDGRACTPAFAPYGAGGHGANVGAGDIDCDGLDEVLTGPGPSSVYGPQVRAFEPSGSVITKVNFYAYGTLRYGVKVAGANVDCDPCDEILTAPGPGTVFGPHIRGWNYDSTAVQPLSKVTFFAFSTLRLGCNLAGGDIDGDGYDEILAGAGPSPSFGAQVRGFDVDCGPLTPMPKVNFFAFSSMHGATLAASDIESDGVGGYGDTYDEIEVGRGPGPSNDTEVHLYDYDSFKVTFKYRVLPPYPWSYGINLAGGDVDAGDADEVVTAPGPDPAALSRILAWEWNPLLGTNPDGATLQTIGTDDFVAFPGQGYGATVAVGTFE